MSLRRRRLIFAKRRLRFWRLIRWCHLQKPPPRPRKPASRPPKPALQSHQLQPKSRIPAPPHPPRGPGLSATPRTTPIPKPVPPPPHPSRRFGAILRAGCMLMASRWTRYLTHTLAKAIPRPLTWIQPIPLPVTRCGLFGSTITRIRRTCRLTAKTPPTPLLRALPLPRPRLKPPPPPPPAGTALHWSSHLAALRIVLRFVPKFAMAAMAT